MVKDLDEDGKGKGARAAYIEVTDRNAAEKGL
jgi:hypothetical protein